MTSREVRPRRVRGVRGIPDATVARLPVYHRALSGAGVSAASPPSPPRSSRRPPASTPPSCARTSATSGRTAPAGSATTSPTSSSTSAARSASPRTGPSSSSASATSGHALANYGGFGSRGLPRRRAGRRRPGAVRRAGRRPRRSSRWPTSSARRGARREHRGHRDPRERRAGRLRPAGRRRRHEHPELRAARAVRPARRSTYARSTSPPSCRSSPSTSSARSRPRGGGRHDRPRRRPLPPDCSRRPARAHGGGRRRRARPSPPRSPARAARRRGRRGLDLQPGRGLRRRRPVPRRRRRRSSELLAAAGGLPLEELTPHLYVHYDDRAVQHLFSVVCGLDSMVVGEAQILGQVRLGAARRAGARAPAGTLLGDLFQDALRVGKRAHAETGIDRAGSRAGVAAAWTSPAPCSAGARRRRVLLVGAGVDERPRRAATCSAPASPTSPSSTARWTHGDRLAATARRASPVALDDAARGARRGRPRRLLHRRRRARRDAGDVRRGARPARHRCRSASGAPRPRAAPRRRPRGRGPAGRHRRRPRAARRPAGRRRAARPTSKPYARSSPTRSRSYLAARAVGQRRADGRRAAAAGPPTSSPPSWPGSTRGCPTSTPPSAPRSRRPCAAPSTSCCTRRPCGSRSWPPTATRMAYAEALHALFDLDPAAVESVDRVDAVLAAPRRSRSMTRRSGSAPAAARSPCAQSRPVAAALSAATGREVELVEIVTEGDRNHGPLAPIGGTGVFVSALRDALLAGDIDLAVHSLQGPADRPGRRARDRRRARRARTRATCLVARDGLHPRRAARRVAASVPARRAAPPSCGRSAMGLEVVDDPRQRRHPAAQGRRRRGRRGGPRPRRAGPARPARRGHRGARPARRCSRRPARARSRSSAASDRADVRRRPRPARRRRHARRPSPPSGPCWPPSRPAVLPRSVLSPTSPTPTGPERRGVSACGRRCRRRLGVRTSVRHRRPDDAEAVGRAPGAAALIAEGADGLMGERIP